MKSIRLIELTLKNFKGIKTFSLEADGKDLNVFGANASGKTTLYDSFLFLLFNKDSQNQKDFAIKTIIDGQPVHKLDHEVEATLDIDGQRVTLKKTYREDWKKKRGSATETFSGHETVYHIDNVPKKKGEYDKFIADMAGEEELFKLLSNPLFFNEQIKWQDRRNALMRIAGEVSNDEIFKSNSKLKGLATILDGKKIEDFKKMKAAEKTKINQEIEKIPVRIDEIQLSIPEGAIDSQQLEKELAAIDSTIEAHHTQIQSIRSGNAILTKQGELQHTENDMHDLKRDIEFASKEEVYKLRTKVQEEQSNLRILESQREKSIDDRDGKIAKINTLSETMNELRPQVLALKAQSFAATADCECPTCKQALPAEQVDAANEKAEAAFNLKKANDIESIVTQGKSLKAEVEQITSDIEVLDVSIEGMSDDIEKKGKSLDKLNEQLTQAESGVKDVSEDADYQLLAEKAKELKEAIAGLQEGTDEAIAGIQDEIAAEKAKRQVLQVDIAKHAGTPDLKKRIAELEAREEMLAQEYEKIEEHVYLADEFIRAKVRMMEERINSHFELARFQLFSEQINGGLTEVCETKVNGVTYSNLNNAMKSNVGLDIIRTLSKFHGMESIIFLDNAESIVEPLKTDAQMIRLIVSGEDEKLRVERV